jgi:hypothetical protein
MRGFGVLVYVGVCVCGLFPSEQTIWNTPEHARSVAVLACTRYALAVLIDNGLLKTVQEWLDDPL